MAVKRYDGSAWQTVAGLGAQGAAATSSSIATWVKTASGGETSLSGNDDNSQALSYTIGQELVFINGTLLKRGSDYTATNGTSITGLTALAANDVATVWTVNAFSVTGAIANTIVDAKGDLLVGTAADTPGRIAVGTDGQVLTAASTTGTGLTWATPTGGGVDLLSTTTLNATSTTINIVTTYKNLIIVGDSIYGSAENTTGGIVARFNSDTGNNYHNTLFRFTTTAGGGTDGVISSFNVTERLSSTNSIGRWSTFLLTIPNYTETSTVPFFIQSKGATNSGTATLIATGQYDGTAAISSITLFGAGGETLYGTVKIYGAK